MIEHVQYNERLLSIIIRNSYKAQGITFVTPPELSQQLAYMNHPSGKIIEPHTHNPVTREVVKTQEVLFIKRGRLRIDFYNLEKEYLESRVLNSGDIILLIDGGHGFEVLEEIEMIEVKQGPYAGEADKTRFLGINSEDIKLNK